MDRTHRHGLPLPEPIRERLRALVAEHGEYRAAQLLGVGHRAVERGLAGLGIRRATETAIRSRLDVVEAEERRRTEGGAR